MRRRVLGVAPRRIAAALGLLVVAAVVVVAVVLLARGGPAASDKTDSSPSTIFRPLKTPFSDGGARFEIKPASSASWAAGLRRRQSPGAGRRWVAVAVPIHNVSQMDLRPRVLGYRIVTPAGLVIGPDFLEVRAATIDGKGRLAKGALTSVHLGFQVPKSSHDLTLAFDAGGIRQPSVRVLLGQEG